MWMALGNFSTSCRDAAIKYLFRFGKKDGNQKADLLKAMHFIMYMYQHEFLKDAKPTKKEEAKPKPKISKMAEQKDVSDAAKAAFVKMAEFDKTPTNNDMGFE
jgi:hypothetical protein